MYALHALNPYYTPRLGDFLHRSAMQGHTPETFNTMAIVLNATPAAVPWIGAIVAVGSVLKVAHRLASRMSPQVLAFAMRHYLWRIVSAWSGGLTVTGRWRQKGGCIVVANHTSHADTAVLLAALPPQAQPVFVAAADYWFDVPVRRFVLTSLAGGLPVRRTEGACYAALLAAVKPALAQGRTVVIYPEGTRSTDGKIGKFRSGAVHLARDCGVPVVPVAILGTGDVLAKGGSYTRSSMEVRIGEPIDPSAISADELRHEVVAMRDAQPVRENQFWSAVARLLGGSRRQAGRPDLRSVPTARPHVRTGERADRVTGTQPLPRLVGHAAAA